MQFVECLEDLKNAMLNYSYSSSKNAAIKWRTTIKKARIVYPKRIVDELYALTEDFGEYYLDVLKRCICHNKFC